jgi:hypothetical protein
MVQVMLILIFVLHLVGIVEIVPRALVVVVFDSSVQRNLLVFLLQ